MTRRLRCTWLIPLWMLGMVAATSAAIEIVGIDDARDRIVAIDLASAETRSLIEGRGLRPSAVHWAPDGSFAYLVVADGLLIYDPGVEDVVGRIGIRTPGLVSFSTTRALAFVEDWSGFKVLDTDSHSVIGENSFRSTGERWIFSSSSRWAASRGVVVEVENPETEHWFDGGSNCWQDPIAGAEDRFYLPCQHYVAVIDAAAAQEIGRIYLNGQLQALAVLDGEEKALAVTNNGLSVIEIDGLYVSQAKALPFYLGPFSDREVAFSPDGALLFHESYAGVVAYNSNDLTVAWGHSDRNTLFLSDAAVTADGSYPFRVEKWRAQDRSFYRTSTAGLERVSVADGNTTVILRDYNFTDLSRSEAGAFVYALSDGDEIVRQIEPGSAEVEELAVLGAVGGNQLIGVSPSDIGENPGENLVVATRGYYEYSVALLGNDATELLGEIATVDDNRPNGPYLRGLAVLALSGERALVWGTRGSWHGFIDLAAGTIVSEGPLETSEYSDIVAAVRAPAGDGAYLALGLEGEYFQLPRPLLVYVAPDQEREVWRGAYGMVPSALAVEAQGQTVYVAVHGAESSRSYIAEIDGDGELVAELPLAAPVRELALSQDGRWLIASLSEAPHLVVIDTAARRVVGAVGDAPDLMSIVMVEDGGAGADLDTTALAPYSVPTSTPPAPDVLIYSDWLSYLPDGSRSVVIARHDATQRVSLTEGPFDLWSTSAGVAYVETRGDEGRALHELDLATGELRSSISIGPPEKDPADPDLDPDLDVGVDLDIDLRDDALAVARDGSVAFATRPVGGGERAHVLVSVVDLAAREVVHSIAVPGFDPYSSLSPDDRWLHLGTDDGQTVFFDTADSGTVAIDTPVSSIALTNNGYAYFTTAWDGSTVWRIALASGAAPEQVQHFSSADRRPQIRLYESGDGSLVLVDVYFAYGERELFVIGTDGTTRLRMDLPPNFDALTTSLDGERLYLASLGMVDVFDIHDGALLARIPVEGKVGRLQIGCVQPECPSPRTQPDRTPWRGRGTVTPTPVRTPTATPTPDATAPPALRHDWFAIDRVAGRPGDTVEVGVRFRSSEYFADWRGGIDHDLLFPEVVEINRWLDGTPDCSRSTEDWNEETRARFEWIPGACGPEECEGVRAVAVTEFDVDDGTVLYDCRVRIRDDAQPGEYPVRSRNLFVESWVTEFEPAVVDGVVVVVPPSPRLPDPPGRGGEPVPEPLRPRAARLRGGQTTADRGENVGVGFYLEGPPLLLSGRLVAEVEIPATLSLSPERPGAAYCGVGWRNARTVDIGMTTLTCDSGPCAGLRVSLEIPALDRYRSEQDALEALFDRRYPLFECRYAVAADSRRGDHLLSLRSATLDGEPLERIPGVVRVGAPDSSPTPTPAATAIRSASATPTFLETPRRCEVEAPGVSTLCIEDLEIEPGDEAELVVRFRSADQLQAGLEFEIDGQGTLAVAPIAGTGRPDCSVSPDLRREASVFAYLPGGRVKGLVLSFSDLSPLPDDVAIARCRVTVSTSSAPGVYDIRLLRPGGSDPAGNPLPVTPRHGRLRVRGDIPATVTPTSVPPSPTRRDGGRELAEADPVAGSPGCQTVPTRAVSGLGWVHLLLVGTVMYRRARWRRRWRA